ncbi:hypothetical protein [Alteromonas sp. C1M14]|uniref:hypothetical protein n=1 Tax=Alteromonas sp. C1M14 TaxID=2841567 RepID=UPI001C09A003|nr:hypothetical protein [Alteromonas sp. C1M14]MBU2977770.1 hypothetical protein [Alteromonas sp. C1M14]
MNDTLLNGLYWLEESAIGDWVATSIWGYPIFLTLHTIGMGTIVGLSLMQAISVLLPRVYPLQMPIYRFWKVALLGLILNVISGSVLFIGSASSTWFNWPFRIKLMLILTGVLLSTSLTRDTMQTDVTGKQRIKAAAVVVVWLSALVAGRLIAYID